VRRRHQIGYPTKLIELIEGRTAAAVSDWLDAQPADWRAAIRWGVLTHVPPDGRRC
jgi:hypothetical protein